MDRTESRLVRDGTKGEIVMLTKREEIRNVVVKGEKFYWEDQLRSGGRGP